MARAEGAGVGWLSDMPHNIPAGIYILKGLAACAADPRFQSHGVAFIDTEIVLNLAVKFFFWPLHAFRLDQKNQVFFGFDLFCWLQWFFPESTVAFENGAKANPTCVILGVVLRLRVVYF